MEWYALFVKTGKEDYICNDLKKIFDYNNVKIRLLVPKRKLMEYHSGVKEYVEKPLFPGYILFETCSVEQIYYIIKNTQNRYIYSVLRTQAYFQKVNPKEIETILALTNSCGVIEKSLVFVENDRIRIKEGPLTNYTGVIEKICPRKKRAKIRLIFLDRICHLDICVECIETIDKQEIKNTIVF